MPDITTFVCNPRIPRETHEEAIRTVAYAQSV